jgi:hypothetical protein
VNSFKNLLCPEEPFVNQPSLGVCTGFLIADRYLLTAGHCVLPAGITDDPHHPFCEAFSWYFDYTISAEGRPDTEHIDPRYIYRCKRLVRAENVEGPPLGNDFALIELDRPVVEEIRPLPLSFDRPRRGDAVFTIGYPLGLPAKFSGYSLVSKADSASYFEVNLDTQSGNSGGPVFNYKKQVVGLLVSGHPVDFFTDSARRCEKLNRCDDKGLHCLKDSKFIDLPTSNFVQFLEPLRSYLP